MTELSSLQEKAKLYRQQACHLQPAQWLHDEKQAVHFVNERGFVFFWPIKNLNMPSLWTATVGDRPVPNNHDDPGHITWRWKDDLLDKRVWYYAKLIRKKATILSYDLAPYFYTLTPNYGDYQNDYLLQYKNGMMEAEAKNIYEALLKKGPLHTLDLRREARLTATDKKYRFNKALADLQAEMKILPIGIATAGRWGYAMVYDIVARYHPEIEEKARFLTETEAQRKIVLTYLRSVGIARSKDIARLFGWKNAYVLQAAEKLQAEDHIQLRTYEEKETYFVLTSLFKLQ